MSVVFISCDKRSDYFENENEAISSAITFGNSHTWYSASPQGYNSWQDTLKHGFNYEFILDILDENDQVEIEFIGDGSMNMNGSSLTMDNYPVGTYSFSWTPDTTGDFSFDVKIRDVYDVTTTYHWNMHVFENRVPITWWEVLNTNALSPLHKTIKVHGNDGDAIYGGSILYYRYVIGSDTTDHPYADMEYVFPSSGNYTISVKAMDSNNEWGNEITIGNYPIN